MYKAISLNSLICMLLFQIYSSIIIRVRTFQSVMYIYLYLFLFLSHHQKYLSDSQKLLPLCRMEQNDWLFAFTQWSKRKERKKSAENELAMRIANVLTRSEYSWASNERRTCVPIYSCSCDCKISARFAD